MLVFRLKNLQIVMCEVVKLEKKTMLANIKQI